MKQSKKYRPRDYVSISILSKKKDEEENKKGKKKEEKSIYDKERYGIRFSKFIAEKLKLESGEIFYPERIGMNNSSIILNKGDKSNQNFIKPGEFEMKTLDKQTFYNIFPTLWSIGPLEIYLKLGINSHEGEYNVAKLHEWLNAFGKFNTEITNNSIKIYSKEEKMEEYDGDPFILLVEILLKFTDIFKNFDIFTTDFQIHNEIQEDEQLADKYYLKGLRLIAKELLKYVGDLPGKSNLRNTSEGITLIRILEGLENLIDSFATMANLLKEFPLKTELEKLSTSEKDPKFKENFNLYYDNMNVLLRSSINRIQEFFIEKNENNLIKNEKKIKHQLSEKISVAKFLINNKEYEQFNKGVPVNYNSLVKQLIDIKDLTSNQYIRVLELIGIMRDIISYSGRLHKLILTYILGFKISK